MKECENIKIVVYILYVCLIRTVYKRRVLNLIFAKTVVFVLDLPLSMPTIRALSYQRS